MSCDMRLEMQKLVTEHWRERYERRQKYLTEIARLAHTQAEQSTASNAAAWRQVADLAVQGLSADPKETTP